MFADETSPALTTVDMNIERLGAHAASALQSAMEGELLAPGVNLLPCTLHVRGSTVS